MNNTFLKATKTVKSMLSTLSNIQQCDILLIRYKKIVLSDKTFIYFTHTKSELLNSLNKIYYLYLLQTFIFNLSVFL